MHQDYRRLLSIYVSNRQYGSYSRIGIIIVGIAPPNPALPASYPFLMVSTSESRLVVMSAKACSRSWCDATAFVNVRSISA